MGTAHADKWQWRPGELVQLRIRRSPSHPMYHSSSNDLVGEVGVVLRYFDSNVYEAASVDVLIDGQEIHLSTRELIRLKEIE